MFLHPTSRVGRRFRTLAFLASALVLWSVVVVTANADSFKPYELTLPKNIVSGSPISILVRNDTTTQQLGSLQIGVPSGFTISGTGASQVSTNRITFQGLALTSGSSTTLQVTVTTPCGSGTGMQWSFQAQQANQWQSGNNANYLTLANVTYSDLPLSPGVNPVGDGTTKVNQPTANYSNVGCQYDLSLPASLSGGANAVSVGVTNVNGTSTLSSITIGVSSGYSISSTSGNGSSVTFAVNAGPGATTTLSFTVNAPCSGDLTWSFQTSPTFVLRNVNGSPAQVPVITQLANPACTLKFLAPTGSTKQVADAQKGTVLSAGAPGVGLPIRVAVYDGAGQNPMAVAGVVVGLALTGGSPSATLGGTTSQATDATGVASFGDLTVDTSAPSYRLHATSAVTSAADSNAFNVVDNLQSCTSSTCTFTPVTDSSGNSYGAQPNKTSAGQYLVTSVNPTGLTVSCSSSTFGSYPDNPSGNAWVNYSDPTAVLTATLQISKADVNFDPNNGASFYQICFSAPYTFPTRAGTTSAPDPTTTTYFANGKQWYTGVLPDCGKAQGAPCTSSRNKTGSGDVVVTFQFIGGDPSYH